MSRVRIVGGAWRSRYIVFTPANGLRPTPDAVRETLFNWLGQDLSGLSCLDLFAGSGVLGFEAASRGASRVTLVERDPRAAARLRQNAAALGGDPRLEVLRCDAVKFVSSVARPFDLLFLDPPYRQGWIERIEPWLPHALAPDARIYAEAEQPLDSIGEWVAVRQGRSGQVFYQLLQRGGT